MFSVLWTLSSGVEELTRSSSKGVWQGDFQEIDLLCFETTFSLKSPMPERRKAACKNAHFTRKTVPMQYRFETGPGQFFTPDFCKA